METGAVITVDRLDSTIRRQLRPWVGIASHPGLALSFPARSCVTPRAARWFLVYSEQAEAV